MKSVKINTALAETLKQAQIMTYQRNQNLKDIISNNKIEFNQVIRKALTIKKNDSARHAFQTNEHCCRQSKQQHFKVIKTKNIRNSP